MARKAIRSASDSQNPVEPLPSPRRRDGSLTFTVTGWQAGKLLNSDPNDDEWAFFCPGCLRVLSVCSCPVEDR